MNQQKSGAFEHSPPDMSYADSSVERSRMQHGAPSSVTPPESFISKIPTIKKPNLLGNLLKAGGAPSLAGNRGQEDLNTLHQQNLKLKDMVLLVVDKLDAFIIKTLQIRQQKKMINKSGKPPDNEIYV